MQQAGHRSADARPTPAESVMTLLGILIVVLIICGIVWLVRGRR